MLNWLGVPREDNGMVERRFEVIRDGAAVPGALWTPSAQTGRAPLVLLGHGATQHKTHPGFLRRKDMFTGVATVAIDAPVHGDRGGLTSPEDPRFAASVSAPDSHDSMIADWHATIDALEAEEIADPGRLGYWGMSLGAFYGLPLVAAEPRIKVAALGLAGLSGPWVSQMLTDPRRSGIASAPTLRASLVR